MTSNIERVSFHVPQDLVFDILTKLSVKSLIRLKSVCKTWYYLIENHEFIEKHQPVQSFLEHNPAFNAVLVTGKTKKTKLLHLSETSGKFEVSNSFYIGFSLVGICNGLVCASSSPDGLEFTISNPTTRQFRKVPPFNLPIENNEVIFLGFSLHGKGYKLIRIVCNYAYCFFQMMILRTRAELYNMCTDTWQKIDVKLGKVFRNNKQHLIEKDYRQPVLVDDVFFWKVSRKNQSVYIVSFDMNSNVLNEIVSPPDVYGDLSWHLQEIEDKLALVVYSDIQFELWVLNSNKRSWAKTYKIEYISIVQSFPGLYRPCRIRVLGCTKNDELVLGYTCADFSKFHGNDLKLILYNLINGEVKSFHISEDEWFCNVNLYTESLVPINKIE